ncbi:hypothetical protein L218DRAFT_634565 [Marasmius fiardii PR-910]|nr:hypothetical protein L218DRAFT_634565 [Marasmius fiardii PR-910]
MFQTLTDGLNAWSLPSREHNGLPCHNCFKNPGTCQVPPRKSRSPKCMECAKEKVQCSFQLSPAEYADMLKSCHQHGMASQTSLEHQLLEIDATRTRIRSLVGVELSIQKLLRTEQHELDSQTKQLASSCRDPHVVFHLMTWVVPTAEWSAAWLMSLAISCGWAMPDTSKLRVERNSQGDLELLDDENHVLDVIPTSAPMTASMDDSSIFCAVPQTKPKGRKTLSSVPAIVQQDI